MPRSSSSLARPLGGAVERWRGGKELARLSRQGVTGVLGPVRRELGVCCSGTHGLLTTLERGRER